VLATVPSAPKRGQRLVELSASVLSTVVLFNELLEQKVRAAELARRLLIPRRNVSRLLDPQHPTKIDNIAATLRTLGKTLDIRGI
jgi:antitoxin HicB